MHIMSTITWFDVPRLEKNSFVGVFPPIEPCTWSLPCLYEQNTLRAKCGGVNPLNSTSESSEPAIVMHTKCHQFLLLMVDFKTLNKEEEQVKEDEPIKPKSNLKPRWVWL